MSATKWIKDLSPGVASTSTGRLLTRAKEIADERRISLGEALQAAMREKYTPERLGQLEKRLHELGASERMATTDDLETGNAPETGGWRFDDEVTQSFSDMLDRSIPQIDVMRKAVTDAACWMADRWGKNAMIVDLGSSRGDALAPIVDRLGIHARYTAYEISDPMLDVLRERFDGWVRSIGGTPAPMTVKKHDLRDGYPTHSPAAAILSVLCLQFVPIEYRQRLIQGVYDNLVTGGAFIWVEKVLGATAALDALEVDLYYGLKRENGYSQEAIDRKRLSLEGVLVPLPAAYNEDLLKQAGFREVDVCWRWMNFCMWIAIKR